MGGVGLGAPMGGVAPDGVAPGGVAAGGLGPATGEGQAANGPELGSTNPLGTTV